MHPIIPNFKDLMSSIEDTTNAMLSQHQCPEYGKSAKIKVSGNAFGSYYFTIQACCEAYQEAIETAMRMKG